VKLLKLSIVPAVLLFSVVMAAPAFAHEATITNLTASCNSDHKVCFAFDVATSGFDQTGRDVLVDLIDTQQSKVLETKTEHLSADTTHVMDCFNSVVSTTTSLTIKIHVPSGSDLDLGDSQTSVDTHGCVAPSPSPSPPSPSPSAATSPSTSPSATTTTTLANTGGFDFRFPLIGLILLVAGGTLYVIGASRGRSTTK
jgi:hypothetical protein